MTLYSDYKDGLQLKYRHAPFHSIEYLTPLDVEPGQEVRLPVIWESDADGRHITVFSEEQVAVIWRYETKISLSDPLFACDRWLDSDRIQKASRQFKNLTLRSYAKMINASMLDVVAAFQRRGRTLYRTVRGHACYLFEGNGELLRDSILAKPMKRGELEVVALLATQDKRESDVFTWGRWSVAHQCRR